MARQCGSCDWYRRKTDLTGSCLFYPPVYGETAQAQYIGDPPVTVSSRFRLAEVARTNRCSAFTLARPVVSAAAKGGNIIAEWLPVDGASHYQVRYTSDFGEEFTVKEIVEGAVTQTITRVGAGTYHIQARAYDGLLVSDWSDAATVVIVAPPPE